LRSAPGGLGNRVSGTIRPARPDCSRRLAISPRPLPSMEADLTPGRHSTHNGGAGHSEPGSFASHKPCLRPRGSLPGRRIWRARARSPSSCLCRPPSSPPETGSVPRARVQLALALPYESPRFSDGVQLLILGGRGAGARCRPERNVAGQAPPARSLRGSLAGRPGGRVPVRGVRPVSGFRCRSCAVSLSPCACGVRLRGLEPRTCGLRERSGPSRCHPQFADHSSYPRSTAQTRLTACR